MLGEAAAESSGQSCAAVFAMCPERVGLVAGMELERLGRDAALATLRLTNSMLDRHGPRIAGTRQCLNAADQIAEMLRVHCDKVVQERFEMHPGSFWNVGRVMAISYLFSVLLLLGGGFFIYLGLLAALFGMTYGTVVYVFNGRLFDGWFAPAEGCNVAGVIEPAGEVKRQVILSGHHDSPYVLSFLLGWKRLARARLVIAGLTYAAMVVVAAVAVIEEGLRIGDPIPMGVIGAEAVAGFFFVGPLYYAVTRLQSPGAGDNLNSTAIAITAAVHFDLRRKKGSPLKNTRVIVLSTDGEEVGMRGAADYARRHKKELVAVPTFVLNMDSIYALKDLTCLTKDRNGTARLSEKMAQECSQIAAALGHSAAVMPLGPGGGGTDAAAFAKNGVESTSVIGISASGIGKKTVYHTPQDTVEHIEPQAVEVALDIVVNYIMRKDREGE